MDVFAYIDVLKMGPYLILYMCIVKRNVLLAQNSTPDRFLMMFTFPLKVPPEGSGDPVHSGL